MSVLMGALKIVFGFTILIGIHELGHAIAAILCGVKVKRFSIGIGPGLKIKNVPKLNELVISPLVIGGYVEMDEKELSQKSFWKKFFVYVSGMLANVLLTIVVLIFFGKNVFETVSLVLFIWVFGWPYFLMLLLQGKISVTESVAGPIGIGQMMVGSSAPYLVTLAILSLAIAMFNLLPLLPLDGGRILANILEKIFGKEKTEKINSVLQYIGIFAILFLFVFAISMDFIRIFS